MKYAESGPGREFWAIIDAEWTASDRVTLKEQAYRQLLEESGEIIASEAYIAWLRSTEENGKGDQ